MIRKLQNSLKSGEWILLQTGDCHQSEYVCERFEAVKYFSGFTGSNGTLLVSAAEAFLWTDGRYFIQAEKELFDGIFLMKSGEWGVRTVEEKLEAVTDSGSILYVDENCIGARFGEKLAAVLGKKNARIKKGSGIIDRLWKDRPALPSGPVRIQEGYIAGRMVAEKLSDIRVELNKNGADFIFMSALDDIMWTFNIRGSDVAYSPVAFAYAYIDRKKAVLFLQGNVISAYLRDYALKNCFLIECYEDVKRYLKKHVKGKVPFIDKNDISYGMQKLILKKSKKVVYGISPAYLFKAEKNQSEIAEIKKYFLQDSAAVVRFMKECDERMCDGSLTECEAADILRSYRQKIPGYIEDSFATISAYGENAAMAHYEPSSDRQVRVENKGFLLMDSGGQYKGATTDITRTYVCGSLTDDMKRDFTLVLIGFLRLMNAVFLKGATGRNLDILARLEMWKRGIDFKHGTGHGVGCCLNVHEGPQGIRVRAAEKRSDGELKPGMLITDEPGIYRAGEYGIRTENTLMVVSYANTADGEFYRFEPMTLVPIDMRAVDFSLMTDEDREYLRLYQEFVRIKLAPVLSAEENDFLKMYCERVK